MGGKGSVESLASFLTQRPKTLLLIAIVVLFFTWPRWGGGGSTLSTGLHSSGCPKFGIRYGLMFDAGSTGSRIHVFKFDFQENGKKKLLNEVFEEVKPGLSSYKEDPKKAADSLIPLLEAGVKNVPASAMSCTPIELKATAGLRLAGKKESEAILHQVEKLFRTYKFYVPPNCAIIMDGKDEGPYAWLTVNFLLGSLGSGASTTAAVIDMGGASTQIVFVPNARSALEDAPRSNLYDVNLPDNKFQMYQHSHLGLGLKEAEKAIAKLETEKECSFIPNSEGKMISSFEKCLPLAEKILRKGDTCTVKPCSFRGVFQPDMSKAFHGKIFAFSYFYDRMHSLMRDTKDGISSVGEIKEVGAKVCGGKEAPYSKHSHGTMCMDFAYLYSLLKIGYNLEDETPLYIVKKIDGIETAWALGAMILAMD